MRRRVAEAAPPSIATFSGAFQGPMGDRRDFGSGPLVGDVAALATSGCAAPWRRCTPADMTDQESDFDREAVDDTLDAFTGG